MKFSLSLSTLVAIASLTGAAYVPSEPYSTLTPSGTIDKKQGAQTNFDGSFALSVKTILTNTKATEATASVTGSAQKRDKIVGQITDGQVQMNSKASASEKKHSTKSVVNQITDGQIQQQTATKSTAQVVNQITDGQIQQQTATKSTAQVVNQITDGQIQQQSKSKSKMTSKSTAQAVNQITDGQIQQQSKKSTARAIDQITDGQVQQHTTSKSTATAAARTTDGQVRSSQSKTKTKKGAASQTNDIEVHATASSSSGSGSDSNVVETCVNSDALTITLKDGILKDSKGRIGAIVANHQFQFDGPPPQAGTIYAAGWSTVPEDYKEDSQTKNSTNQDEKDKKGKRDDESGRKLALGKQTTFYKCLSGDFYNLYDESIGGQCSEIELIVLKAVKC